MGSFEEAQWVSSGSGTSRRQRRSGTYRWYKPTKLADLRVELEPDVVGDVVAAERALASGAGQWDKSTEGIARLLLRSESIASSHIEGLTIGPKRLLRAELFEREPGSVRYDRRAAQILGNIRATEKSVEEASEKEKVSLDTILGIHRALCEGTDIERFGGKLRDKQNWVGGGNFNPFDAIYVPPAPELVPELMQDIVAYADRTDVSPVVQAALCHSQFETVHPFADGNGRVGRALIQLVLKRRNASGESVPPISLALATERKDYEASLYGMQHWVTVEEGHGAVNDWISTFASAVIAACGDRRQMEEELLKIRSDWARRIGKNIRANSTLEIMMSEIQAAPIFTAKTMVSATGRTYAAVNNAIATLVEARIVEETTKGKRNRVFQVPDVLEEFLLVERRLASPSRDTSIEKPARPVPGLPRG